MATSVRPNVYLTRKVLQPAFELLKNKCKVTGWNEDTVVPRNHLLQHVETAHGLYVSHLDRVDEELLDRGRNLKIIATMSSGFEHIDISACKRRGVQLGHTPDVTSEACAEMGVALVLCTTRRLIEANRHVHDGHWPKDWDLMYMCGRSIQESVIGIMGMGGIGLSMAEKLMPFHPREILYHNRKPNEKCDAMGAKYVSMDDLLRRSDFVICAARLGKETKNMFNAEKFALMKPTAQFFNVGRGGLVDQDALYDALASKQILAAGLDVCTPEPLPKEHKLLTLPNFVLLPHISSATVEARIQMATLTAKNILAGLDGQPLPAPLP